MPQQGTKLVKVEGQLVRVPVDATPDEIDQIVGGAPPPLPRPEARQPGAMQRQPGGPIFTPKDIMRGVVDKALQSGDYETIRRVKEGEFAQDFPRSSGVDPRAYESEAWKYASPGINPRTVAKMLAGTALGTIGGGTAGRYIGGQKYGNIGAGLGALAGGIYGGFRGASEEPLIPRGLGKLLNLSRMGRAVSALAGAGEEPSIVPGAAREMAGGTAATAMPGGVAETGAGAAGSQAGPSGPKSATELSSVVQRTRSGVGPGTAASPTIYTPESLASEQGMSTAALGKGGFNLTIPPEQQKIMQLVQEGKVPMGKPVPSAPAPATPTMASPTQPGGFSGLQQPPSGESPSFGEPEGKLDAIIRGAPGENPAVKSIGRKMGGDTQAMFDLLDKIRKAKRP